MALILSIFAGSPRICTGIIALVFLLILSSILSGFIWNVSGSVSTKTGRAAEPMTTLYVAINVYGETITSSPTPISSTCKAVIRALVPFTVQTQRLAPINSAYFFSNSETVSPLPLNQFPLRSMDRTDFSADLSQTGQEGQGLVLTGLPPRTASLLAFLLALPYAGIVREATAAIVPAEAAVINCRLVTLFLFIFKPFQTGRVGFSPPISKWWGKPHPTFTMPVYPDSHKFSR